jgi:very-short-patch-repair endonuclease
LNKRYIDKGAKRPTQRSREPRQNATDAERRLWAHLSARQVANTRFNRQFPIGPFICDFVSRTAKLIVEVDGGQHALEPEMDERSTEFLRSTGYPVIRFWNCDLQNAEGVIFNIEQALSNSPSPIPFRKREGR